jgi:prepilin-type N-terminal cleavage/methylation domain-containing protein
MRRGFTVLELVVVIGIIGAISAFSVPVIRTYQVRSDLNLATEQATQGLARAKLLAQSAEQDAPWGFFVPAGVLYKGASYAARESQYDEVYPMPSTITVSGSILEVGYSKLEGKPSQTGSIVLTAVDGEQRTIVISISVKQEAVAANPGDTLTICHKPGTANQRTMTIVDSAWPAHHDHGDTLGSCDGSVSSSSSSSRAASSSSSVVSSGSSSTSGTITICHKPGTYDQHTLTTADNAWNGHQKHGDTMGACSSASSSIPSGSICPSLFTFGMDDKVIATRPLRMAVRTLASNVTYGTGGPAIPVTLSYTANGGGKWWSLFGGDTLAEGQTQTIASLQAGDQIGLKMRGYFKQRGWLTYDETISTIDGSSQTILLRRGDALPAYILSSAQQNLRTLLASYLDADHRLTIDPSALLVLTEFTTLAYPPPPEEDFDDAVVLLNFSASSGGTTCP